MLKFLEGKLLSYELKGVDNVGKGPIIACLDISGSMQGQREMWAKAVVLSLMYLAEKQKRAFGFIAFEAGVKARKYFPKQAPASFKDKLDIASINSNGGGTDFFSALQVAFEMRSKEAGLKPADVVFITDGECELREEQLKEILESKKDTRIYGIAINFGGYGEADGRTLASFSDEIATVSSAGEIDLVKKLITKTASAAIVHFIKKEIV